VNARGRLGREIREIRRGQKMTQGELAEKSNVSLLTISRLERGERDPHLGTLARIAKGLGVPPFELLRSAGYFEHEGDFETKE
jgi:XRE family transcriptional regulator, regulator of sulfur utilization